MRNTKNSTNQDNIRDFMRAYRENIRTISAITMMKNTGEIDEDYLEALEEFKVVTLQYGGTQWADDAQFYMAESRFLREEFVLAVYEYDVLLRTMPTSPFVRLARFQKAGCNDALSPGSDLDQEYTRKAIDDYQSFLEYFPTDSLATVVEGRIVELTTKLAKKEFDSGLIYMKMAYYKAATFYFDLVLERYHDTRYAEPALFHKGEALVNRKRYPEAVSELSRFLDKYPSSEFRPEVERLLNDARESLATGVVVRPTASDSMETHSQIP